VIRKEANLHNCVMEEIDDREITKEDDIADPCGLCPPPDRVGRLELEIVTGGEHISFTGSKIGSLIDVNQSKDPEGLLLPCPGPQVSRLQSHWITLQD
uniref:Uncharacterized protein n=1 Tax=Podarcis muralis TaxID=64176 RepID=A0A670KCN4_PODMU